MPLPTTRNSAAANIMLPGTVRLAALPPLSLYVHIPWCVRKCPYCDFNSHEVRGELPEQSYVDALVSDLESALPSIWGRPVQTIFFGGGTPSLLSARAIDRLLAAVRARVSLVPGAEVTLEANPGTVEAERFSGFRDAGVNRLSVGVQSFDPGHLRSLGRIHDTQQAHEAIATAQACFDSVNVDLMYALPGQVVDEALRDLRTALAHSPQHLSVYHLTIEPNTYFHRYPPQVPGDDVAAEMQEALEAMLATKGYVHYETSAFARPGFESRHNLNYWGFGDYLGIGAGAHSKISFPDRIVRQMRYKQPREYLRRVGEGTSVQTESAVPVNDLPFEFMMNAMRLIEGVDPRIFQERTGLPISVVAARLKKAEQTGLLEHSIERLRPTPRGQRFLNDLLGLFLDDEA